MVRAFRARLPLFWFPGAVAVSVVIVVGTLLDSLVAHADGGAAKLLYQLDLGHENNVAAWWTSILLLLMSLHAFDGYALWRARDLRLARGWAVLALLLLLLSADELGSLHERVSTLGKSLGLGMWWALAPFAVILAGLLAYALVALWSSGERRKALLILSGFALFGVVALQEFVEHRVEWSSRAAWALRTVAEEGTELLAVLLLLKVCIANTLERTRRGTGDRALAFEGVRLLRAHCLTAVLVAAPLLAYVTSLGSPKRGRPADWLAAAVFVAAALAAYRRVREGGREPRVLDWALVALCGLASVIAVQTHPSEVLTLAGIGINERLLRIGIIFAAICAIWAHVPQGEKGLHLPAAMLFALMSASLFWADLLVVFVLSQYAALVVYYAISAPLPVSAGPATVTASAPAAPTPAAPAGTAVAGGAADGLRTTAVRFLHRNH